MSPEIPKPSFAKVAATVSPRRLPNESSPHIRTTSNEVQDMEVRSSATGPAGANDSPHIQTGQTVSPESKMPTQMPPAGSNTTGDVVEALSGLHLQPQGSKEISVLQPQRPPVISRESGASDDSQRADSSSEPGTKPPSLDGKSITSGTTFALDEKESLRPDDSASVQAAAEDDDTFSIRGSHFAGSRVGSDLATRARGIQLGDMPDRRLIQAASGSSGQGILTPQSTSSEQQSRSGAEMPPLAMGQDPDALNLIYRHAPDDKLIEAMGTMKDRLYLLRLEKELINFVENSKEPFMDLEQSNSFLRMLAHKLADYYHMTHSFEPNLQKVRIFRTPFCRVPTSLAHFDPAPNPSTSSTPPPVILPKKIMRRGQDGDGGPVSTNPSKPTSEVGSDSKDKDKDKSSNHQKLTREEREEAYKLARERIFGSAEDTATDTDKDTVPSRASSVSGNNRTGSGKGRRGGRHRRDDSDGFDSRNHYAPCWGPQQQTWMPQQYGQPPNGPAMPPPPVYNAQMPPGPVYGQQNVPPYQGMPGMPPNAGYPMYPTPQYNPQPSQQRYPSGGSPMASYGSSAPGTPQQQSWQPPSYSPGYQASSGPPSGTSMQPGIPYAFGQLPANLNPNDPKSQHPIPGSYNRNSAFNPKTQSFVPGGANMPQAPVSQPPFTAPTSHHGSPRVGSSHPNFQGYQQGMPQPYGGGYGMVRQASNTSLPGYHPPQQMTSYPQHAPAQHIPHQPPLQHINPNQAQNMLNRPPVPHQGSTHVFTHLPTYGNPATLPQKPATGI